MAVIELTLVPVGTNTTSVSTYLAKALEPVKANSKVNYQLNPMGTILEGDIDELFPIVRQMQEIVFNEGADRVYSVLKVDDRRDKETDLSYKVKSVEEKMEEK